MKMIEIYNEHGKVGTIINGGHISLAYETERGGKVCVRIEFNQTAEDFRYIYSYETLRNFRERTGDQWVELERWGDKIKVKKSEIVAYSQGKSEGEECVVFKTKGRESSIVCDESIESFEAKIGIRKEDAE